MSVSQYIAALAVQGDAQQQRCCQVPTWQCTAGVHHSNSNVWQQRTAGSKAAAVSLAPLGSRMLLLQLQMAFMDHNKPLLLLRLCMVFGAEQSSIMPH